MYKMTFDEIMEKMVIITITALVSFFIGVYQEKSWSFDKVQKIEETCYNRFVKSPYNTRDVNEFYGISKESNPSYNAIIAYLTYKMNKCRELESKLY